jgi:hypothetical protein
MHDFNNHNSRRSTLDIHITTDGFAVNDGINKFRYLKNPTYDFNMPKSKEFEIGGLLEKFDSEIITPSDNIRGMYEPSEDRINGILKITSAMLIRYEPLTVGNLEEDLKKSVSEIPDPRIFTNSSIMAGIDSIMRHYMIPANPASNKGMLLIKAAQNSADETMEILQAGYGYKLFRQAEQMVEGLRFTPDLFHVTIDMRVAQ